MTVFRVNFHTNVVVGSYEFSQPYRKSLPPPRYLSAGSFQYIGGWGIDIRSRLTGETIARTYSDTFGGDILFPPDSLLQVGYVPAQEPGPLVTPHILAGSTYQIEAAAAWEEIRGTAAFQRITARGAVEGAMAIVCYGWDDACEWIVTVTTLPAGPVDLGIEKLLWPRGSITVGDCTVPEIVVHNFSDEAVDAALRLTIRSGSQVLHEIARPLHQIQKDASVTVRFDAFIPTSTAGLEFDYLLTTAFGGPWADAFNDNDSLSSSIQVTPFPVFTLFASGSSPGSLPANGEAADFDLDGDVDFLQFGGAPKIWRRETNGGFTNVNALSGLTFPPNPRQAVCDDFDRDGNRDFLLVYYGQAPLLLEGQGGAVFADATLSSGLSTVQSTSDVQALDKENDGDLDLVFQKQGPEIVMENDGSGHFTDVSGASGLIDPAQTLDVAAGDVNNDGYPDLFLTNWNSLSRLFVNDGTGHWNETPPSWTFTYGRTAYFLDYDEDGLSDILFVYETRSYLLRNLGNLTFDDVSDQAGVSAPGFEAGAADVDGDGHLDVLIGGVTGRCALLVGGGPAGFTDQSHVLVDNPVVSGRVQFLDLDEDGDLDIYAGVGFRNMGGQCATSGVPETQEPPSGALHIRPNPFDPSRGPAVISWGAEIGKPDVFVVCDVLGRRVRTVNADQLEQSSDRFQWDGRDEGRHPVASGIYYVRLEAGSRAWRAKVVVIR